MGYRLLAWLALSAAGAALAAFGVREAIAPGASNVPLPGAVLSASETPRGTPWPGPAQLPILMYHHVAATRPANAFQARLTVLSSDFEKQLSYLKCSGYSTVTLSQLYDSMFSGAPLPQKAVILSFDDGYRDAFTQAFPLLQKYGFGGTFAIVTGFIGSGDLYMTWDQITAMAEKGMEMVSHSVNHLDLNTSPDATVKSEVTVSHETLEKKLGRAVDFFVYPSGEPFRSGSQQRQEQVVKILQEAGYKGALVAGPDSRTQDPARPFALNRVRIVGGEDLTNFAIGFGGPSPSATNC